MFICVHLWPIGFAAFSGVFSALRIGARHGGNRAAAAVTGVLPLAKLRGGANDGDDFGIVLPPPRQLLHRRHPHSEVLDGAGAVLQPGQRLGVVLPPPRQLPHRSPPHNGDLVGVGAVPQQWQRLGVVPPYALECIAERVSIPHFFLR